MKKYFFFVIVAVLTIVVVTIFRAPQADTRRINKAKHRQLTRKQKRKFEKDQQAGWQFDDFWLQPSTHE